MSYASGWRKTRVLLVLALASECLYIFSFVRPYSLFAYYQSAPDLRRITHENLNTGLWLLSAFAALFLLYGLALKMAKPDRPVQSGLLVVTFTIVFSFSLVFVHSITSNDVYDYLANSRTLAVYHLSPYTIPPSHFPNDGIIQYAGSRRDKPNQPYGPLWFFISATATMAPPHTLLSGLIVLKGIAAGFHVINTVMIWRTLERLNQPWAMRGALIYGWNPFVLFEVAANAHNDVVMVFFVLLAIYLLSKHAKLGVMIALTLGVLVKLTCIVVAPILFDCFDYG